MRGFDGKIALSYGGFELAPGVVLSLQIRSRRFQFAGSIPRESNLDMFEDSSAVLATLLVVPIIPLENLPKGVIPHLS